MDRRIRNALAKSTFLMLPWIDENLGRTPFMTLAAAAVVSFLSVVMLSTAAKRASVVAWIIAPLALAPFFVGMWFAIRIALLFLTAIGGWANPPGAGQSSAPLAPHPDEPTTLLALGPLAGIFFSLPSLLVAFVVAVNRARADK